MSSIRTNKASLLTQRNLGKTTRELTRTFERLSSGLRINRASDDSAGLAVADGLRSDRIVMAQGIRNLNDGLSLLSVADTALAEMRSLVTRILELAEQASNGTLSSTQRAAIDQEAQALSEEYTRITGTTSFNGLSFFDGSLETLSLQAGGSTITDSLGGVRPDGTFSVGASFNAGANVDKGELVDLNSDGNLDLALINDTDDTLSIYIGSGGGTFTFSTSYATGARPEQLAAGDFNNDGNIDFATANNTDGSASIFLGTGSGSFSTAVSVDSGPNNFFATSADLNADGNADLVFANATEGTASVVLGNGDGTFSSLTSYSTGGTGVTSLDIADLDGDGIEDLVAGNFDTDSVGVLLGNGSGGFQTVVTYLVGNQPDGVLAFDFNRDGFLDILNGNTADDTISISLNQGDGTFSSAGSFAAGDFPNSLKVADVNADGLEDLIVSNAGAVDESISVYLAQSGGGFSDPVDYSLGAVQITADVGDINNDGVLDIGYVDSASGNVGFLIGGAESGIGPLLPFSLATQAEAKQALAPLARTLDDLLLQSGEVAAFQSRVEVAISNLDSQVVNLQVAESQIRDADVASEAAELIRLQILQQAATALLAQANQYPATVLQLLE